MTNQYQKSKTMKPIDNDESTEKIDLRDLKEEVCKVHDFSLNIPQREINCKKCGVGRRIEVNQLIEKGGQICLKDGTVLTSY